MTFVRIKGFQIFKDRHGKQRCYHRKTGVAVDLSRFGFGTVEFFAECNRIAALSTVQAAIPGTLGSLTKSYKASDNFTRLKLRTKQDYNACFDYLQPIDATPLIKIDSPLVAKIRDKAALAKGRRFGTYVKTTLSLLFNWGRERGYVKENPARGLKGVKRPKDAPEANRPWSFQERATVNAALPHKLRVPFAFMMYCGLDPGDVVKLLRSQIDNGHINTRRNKTGEPVWIPLPQAVVEALESAPSHSAVTVCANLAGRPWTYSGLDSEWRKVRNRLTANNQVGAALTLKGLRHTVADDLANLGYDERSIADMLGQKTTEMARHYSRRANRKDKLTKMVRHTDEERNKLATKFVKPS